jgi:hypothetical protein
LANITYWLHRNMVHGFGCEGYLWRPNLNQPAPWILIPAAAVICPATVLVQEKLSKAEASIEHSASKKMITGMPTRKSWMVRSWELMSPVRFPNPAASVNLPARLGRGTLHKRDSKYLAPVPGGAVSQDKISRWLE